MNPESSTRITYVGYPSNTKSSDLSSYRLMRCTFLAFSLAFAIFSTTKPLSAQSSDSFNKPGVFRPAELSEDDVLDGWLGLFDEQSLFGWTAVSKADWRVEQGEIRVSKGERGLLRTTSQFDDFEMTLDFKAGRDTNSGVFIRTSPTPKDVLKDCYEINIVSPDDHKFATGAIVGRQETDHTVAFDSWHQMRILADGAKIKVWIDDEKTADYLDPRQIGRGYIGLQFNSGAVAFRNIAIKPLNKTKLFDGKDLGKWNTDQAMESKFDVTSEGALQVLGGQGQVESVDQFGDCVISLLCKTNAAKLNSGVFFRCIPGELMNGYESQIQNGFKPGNRSEPDDCGTGGVFRRANARRVNADDKTWFAKTIIAEGPHISVWVNGLQVTDWTDSRKPNANPRKGFRSDAGTIMLQGHDPTTDILFRNLEARELTSRRK